MEGTAILRQMRAARKDSGQIDVILRSTLHKYLPTKWGTSLLENMNSHFFAGMFNQGLFTAPAIKATNVSLALDRFLATRMYREMIRTYLVDKGTLA